MGNMGHRLGGDVLPHPGNTLQCLRSARGLQVHKKFRYWEFDVHETKDGELIVYHDDSVSMNGVAKSLNELTAKQLRKIAKEELEIEVPTLSEVLEALGETEKPVRVEIRNLYSDEGKQKLIDMVADAKEKHGWNCKVIAWKDRFRTMFPSDVRERWSKEFSKRNLALCRVGLHHVDLFKAHSNTVGRMMFTLGLGPISRRK